MTRIRQGKAAKRANDVVRLLDSGKYFRAYRLAQKRNIKICQTFNDYSDNYDMPNWGLVYSGFKTKIYAMIIR